MKQRLLLFIFILAISLPSYTAHSASFTDVSSAHWANSYINWAVNEGLAQGYKDGSFRPDDKVTEAEFLALILRAYGVVTRKDEQPADWSKSYYNYANKLNWPLTFNNTRGAFRRGDAALLIASAVDGKAYTEVGAIQRLLDTGISRGKSSATVSGYDANGGVTRAEALTFIYMMKDKVAKLSDQTIATAAAALQGVSISDTRDKLLSLMGQPARIDVSEYDFDWYVYNKDYGTYSMFGVRGGTIVALFSNDAENWRGRGSSAVDAPLTSALAGMPAAAKGSAKQDDHYYDYRDNGVRHVLFLDGQENKRIAGILMQLDSLTPDPKTSRGDKERSAMEMILFDLVNAERAQRGIGLLQWDALAGSTARAHSLDMMKNDYFDHTSPSGKSPFDRMKGSGIRYTMAAENIAAGYSNSLFAHYSLLNSPSHRKSILDGKLKRLGTGVAFGGDYGVYYTQNYYTP